MVKIRHNSTLHNFKRWSFLLAALLLASLFSSLLASGASAQPAAMTVMAIGGPNRIIGTRFVDENGTPTFLMGVNYEGHTDRAWLLWEDAKFDPGLIDSNFGMVERAGLNTVRIFVSKTLRDNINGGNWSKLDKIAELAANHHLKLLLTFNDYDEPNLAKEADFDRKVVDHYKNNSTFFGFDLKNEPQFGDIGTADFPAGVTTPLQDDAFIKAYGERMSNDAVKQWRQTSQGKAVIPARFDDRRAYLYANAYRLWQEFLSDSGAWVVSHSGKNSLDYMDSPDSAKWKVYLDALSGTLAKYIEVRQGAIRAANPNAITTIGWSNIIFSKLAANSSLSFVSLHRFAAEGISGLNTTVNLLENLRNTHAGKPVVLEEFGYSNAHDNGSAVDPNLTADYETTLWLYLYGKGFAGGFKWMLTNFPPGFNAVQNNYGLLDNNTQPKPAYHALRAVTGAVKSQNALPHFSTQTYQAAGTDVEYRFAGSDSFFTSAKSANSGPVTISQGANAPFAAWWTGSGAAQMNFMATTPTQVSVNLDVAYAQRNKQLPAKLFAEDQQVQAGVASPNFNFTAQPGVLYRLEVPVTPAAFNTAKPIAGQLYFKETGHNLGGRFRTYWETHGGLALYGYPISEEFNENGLIVQYFERNRFEYHPEYAGTKYEVLLGLLGRSLTAGRENEPAFQRIAPFPSNRDRYYFNETGHSLAFGFKNYWDKNGGLAQFGFPITEEFQERNPTDGKTYTVQYFERARFEYHPEFAGTRYEVLLGHLGWQLVRANGWLP
ncbi:MAG TPA: hypothetical protein VH186_18720 [Chloroflexia bacterium]|nr:hypothetical protein [Chloroflexia bacterium]